MCHGHLKKHPQDDKNKEKKRDIDKFESVHHAKKGKNE
jgi:hypothetical protein